MKTNIVLVTGGFDPVHSGHIMLFNAAKKLGHFLVVGLNSNDWLTRKKGKYFMDISEREFIISHFRMVDKVIKFNDADDTAIDAIKCLLENDNKVIFANGGDRDKVNTPEIKYFKDSERVIFKFGVGGEFKHNSSSDLLNKWTN